MGIEARILCWILLSVCLFLIAFLLLSYILNQDNGVHHEAINRCNQYANANVKLTNCVDNMQFQLTWIVIGLFAIYFLASLFAIYMIRKHELFIKQHPILHAKSHSFDSYDEQSYSSLENKKDR